MIKRIVMILALIGILNISQMCGMEELNPNTVARVAEIIEDLELKEKDRNSDDILSSALRELGVTATKEEIRLAFIKVNSKRFQTPQDQKVKTFTPKEKELAYKMWLMKQNFEQTANEGILPEMPQDVQNKINQTFYEVSKNPVMDGDLEFRRPSDGKLFQFKMKDLLKEGNIDFSNKLFGNISNYLVITTDPEKFFKVDKKSQKVIILISPRFLIEEKLGSVTEPFKPIMAKWKKERAPMGIFWRMERWDNLNWYDYRTNETIYSSTPKSLEPVGSWQIYGDKIDETRRNQHGSLTPPPISSYAKQIKLLSQFTFRPNQADVIRSQGLQEKNVKMTINEEDAYKMWLLQEGINKDREGGNEGEFQSVPKDVQGVIGRMLHKITKNQVLDGQMDYTRSSDNKLFHFKIKELLKEGTLDLSNKEIFGDIGNTLIITTDPEKFFHKYDYGKFVILIAPRFLIEEKLDSTAKQFKPIMAKWNEDKVPIGIFWRFGGWETSDMYDYLINFNIDIISQYSLYDLGLFVLPKRPFPVANYSFYSQYNPIIKGSLVELLTPFNFRF